MWNKNLNWIIFSVNCWQSIQNSDSLWRNTLLLDLKIKLCWNINLRVGVFINISYIQALIVCSKMKWSLPSCVYLPVSYSITPLSASCLGFLTVWRHFLEKRTLSIFFQSHFVCHYLNTFHVGSFSFSSGPFVLSLVLYSFQIPSTAPFFVHMMTDNLENFPKLIITKYDYCPGMLEAYICFFLLVFLGLFLYISLFWISSSFPALQTFSSANSRS